MALRNKDGTPYRLESPNPVMVEQKSWKPDEIIVHNKLKFGSLSVEEEKKEVVPPPPKVPKVENVPDIVEKLETKELTTVAEGEIEIWCLPGKYVEVVDPIYDQKFKRFKYGQKFVFNGFLVEQEDLYIILWSSYKVTEGSILYPKIMDKRWWRVTGIKEENGGYLLYAEITDYHPSFSD